MADKPSVRSLPIFSNTVPSTITAGGGVCVGSGISVVLTTIPFVGGSKTTLASLDNGCATVSRSGPSSFSGSTELYIQQK
jgi:hypothetical protein